MPTVGFAQSSSRVQRLIVQAQAENKSLATRAEALKHISLALELEPGNANCWFIKGQVLQAMDEHELALPNVQKGLQIDPKSALGWELSTGILNGLSRFDEALISANRAVAVNPNDHSLIGRAAVLKSLKRYDESLKSLNDVIRKHPESYEAHSARCRLAKDMKRWRLVIEDATFLLTHSKDKSQFLLVPVRLDRADAYLALKQYEKAIADYKIGLKHSPDQRQFHAGLLRAFTETGNMKAARIEKLEIEKLDLDIQPFK